MKKIITVTICLILSAAALFSCGGEKKESLPPVTTVGLPEDEYIDTSLESEGFKVNIYQTYVEIVEYVGKESAVTVPDSFMGIPVKLIGQYAFFGNETAEKVTLPDSVLVIGHGAFQECKRLKEIDVGSSLEVVSQAAFRDSALEKISLPDTVVTLDRYSFYRTDITEIKLPSGVSVIGKYAFFGCEKLKSVTLCPRLERISEYAFGSCTSLEKLVITDRVESIGDYALTDCTALSSVFVPKGSAVGENVFLGCEGVTVYTPKGSKAYKAADNYGYSVKECASADKMK